ncbi:MAG: phytoene desaturase [Patiriisocius sp.]|jgi:phytoene desaturase
MENTKKKIVIIGAGFSSLSASAYLAKAGYDVHILEKNSDPGGRARQLIRHGFTFDIGPTFYWMPDVFEKFFNDFGKKVEDYYELVKLNPAYRVYFGEDKSLSIADNFEAIKKTFEEVEPGAGEMLQKFIDKAQANYEIAINDLVYKPGQNILEIVTPKTVMKLKDFVDTIRKQVRRYVKHKNLIKLLEFPVLFLGAKPGNTPSFYNFMNYADFKLGTWHPRGGMYQVVRGMVTLAEELGVKITTDCSVNSIKVEDKMVRTVETEKGNFDCDILLSGADYNHTENLLPKEYQQYSDGYWDKKSFAPSALMFYVGFDQKLKNLDHHTLFFDTDFDRHAEAIYDTGEWPDKPLFYASFPSMTDKESAPIGKEAGIFLIPLAPDTKDTPEDREKYFEILMTRMETLTKQDVRKHVIFKESFCVDDFKSEYNSYKGNAYGLANTLMQTHILRPKLKSKKINNLYFTGQLTVPGPGVPPSLISGNIVSDLIIKYHNERTI